MRRKIVTWSLLAALATGTLTACGETTGGTEGGTGTGTETSAPATSGDTGTGTGMDASASASTAP